MAGGVIGDGLKGRSPPLALPISSQRTGAQTKLPRAREGQEVQDSQRGHACRQVRSVFALHKIEESL